MPPEVLEKLLAKLDQVDPLTKEDLLKAILGENNTSLDISKEIKKVISNIDALAELEIEKTFSDVNKKVSDDLTKILSKLDIASESKTKEVFSKLENVLGALGNKLEKRTNALNRSLKNVNSASNSINRLENTIKQLSQKFAVNVPKIEPLKVEVEELPMSKLTSKTPPEIKTPEFEITLSKKSINELKKVFGGLNADSFKKLEEVNEKGFLKLGDDLKGVTGIFRGSGALFDPFGLGSLVRLLKPLALTLGSVGVGLSLLTGSFGKNIATVIDNTLGTNFKKYVNVFQKLVPVDIPDFFAKWGSFILASKAVNSELVQKLIGSGSAKTAIGEVVVGGARGLLTNIPGISSIYKATLGKARELPAELMSQAGRYKDLIKFGFQPEEATSILKAEAKEAASQVAAKVATGPEGAVVKGKILQYLAEKLGMSGGRVLIEKLPFGIGALFGLGFGLKRISEGDTTGGLLSVASGLSSIVPGAGTALSFVLDALDVGITIKAENSGRTKGQVFADDFIGGLSIVKWFKGISNHVEQGNYWYAYLDLMRLVVPEFSESTKIDNIQALLDADVADYQSKDLSGKKPDFTEMGKMVKRRLWKAISPYIPKALGIRNMVAASMGYFDQIELDEQEEAIAKTVTNLDLNKGGVLNPLSNQKSSPESDKLDEVERNIKMLKEPLKEQNITPNLNKEENNPKFKIWDEITQNKQPELSKLSLDNFKQNIGFSADEEFNKIKSSSVLGNPDNDFKNYMTSLNAAVFNLSNNFKDLSKTLSESSGNPSMISIDNSTQSSGGENYFSGGRDQNMEFRLMAKLSLNGS